MLLMPGDLIQYVGKRFVREIGSKVGEVVTHVSGSNDTLVVEFGDDSYVMNKRNVRKYVPTPGNKEPEVHVRKRRRDDED